MATAERAAQFYRQLLGCEVHGATVLCGAQELRFEELEGCTGRERPDTPTKGLREPRASKNGGVGLENGPKTARLQLFSLDFRW